MHHVFVFMQTLHKLDFRPPEPFVMACANFTAMQLEGTLAGMVQRPTMETSTVATLLSGLVAWKVSPSPPMLMMVCFSPQLLSVQEIFCLFSHLHASIAIKLRKEHSICMWTELQAHLQQVKQGTERRNNSLHVCR